MKAKEQNTNNHNSLPATFLKNLLRFLLPAALTVLLVWWLFKKVNFTDMMEIIRQGCDYRWILLAMLISVFSHILRAMRWQLQLHSLGIKSSLMELTSSVFGCYALNLIFPRLGEVWRCTFVAQRQRAPFTTVFGSMLAERLADTLSVGLLFLLTLLTARDAIESFMDKYRIGRDIVATLSSPLVWIAMVGVLAAVSLTLWLTRNTRPVRKCAEWGRQLWQGFSDIAAMPHRARFLLFTLLIWGCYYFQLYVAFFAFPFTTELCTQPGLAFGLQPSLVAFVLSAIGMAIPSNGGLGPWNIAVMFGLAVYGITDAQGTAFSVIQWSGQTIMLILLGIFTFIWIAATRKKKH